MVLAPLRLSTIIPTTKGYKTMETIEIGDYVFDNENKPTMVTGVAPIKMSEEMYEIKLIGTDYCNQGVPMVIGSDGEHRFPFIIKRLDESLTISHRVSNILAKCNLGFNKNGVILSTTKQIFNLKNHLDNLFEPYYIYMQSFGGFCWKLENITKVPNELVRCIEVDSPSHLFMITDIKDIEWEGGDKYKYEQACILCHNTQRNDADLLYNYELEISRNGNKITILWEDLQIGDVFEDGSYCVAIGEWNYKESYEIIDSENNILKASGDHVLFTSIISNKTFEMNNSSIFEASKQARERLNEDDCRWMCVNDLLKALELGYDVINAQSGTKIVTIKQLSNGEKQKVRCIKTNTGYYPISTYLNHNSIIPGV